MAGADERGAAEGGGALTAPRHQRPPAFSIAASSARLDAVRRSPLLRGISTTPVSTRRRSMSAANSAKGMGRSALKVGDAIISCRFMADARFHIVRIGVGMKAEQDARLFQHVGGAARGILAHAVGDHVLDRDDCGDTVGAEVNQEGENPGVVPI